MSEILIKFEMHISMYMNSFSRLYEKLQLTVVLPTSQDVHAKLAHGPTNTKGYFCSGQTLQISFISATAYNHSSFIL